MGFFKKKTPSDYEIIRQKAEDILKELGTEKEELTYNIAPTARYYKDICYKGFGLDIVKLDHMRRSDDIRIKYRNSIVFCDGFFSRGTWENVLDEVHESIPVLLQEKEEKRRVEKHKLEILQTLNSNSFSSGQTEINDDVIVGRYAQTSYSGCYLGTNYYVYENGATVFSGEIDSIYNEKVTIYTPGKWEKDLEFYCEMKNFERERMHQEILAKERVEAEEEAQEAIKQLRKMRGK